MPRSGDKAPDFDAVTTTGNLKFSDYNMGSWVILFSHPADFAPVCIKINVPCCLTGSQAIK